MMRTWCALSLLCCTLLTPAALAATPVYTLTGVANFGQNKFGNGSATPRKMGLGGGLLYESRQSPGMGWEYGLLYVTRKIGSPTDLTMEFSSEASLIQVPVLARFHLNKTFGVGAGAYGSYVVSGGGEGAIDFGLAASFSVYLPAGNNWKLALDGRYLIGLKNQDLRGGDNSEKTSDMQLLAGIRFEN